MSLASQIAAVQTAIAAGVTTVSYGDKRVEYRSLSELRQILADLQGQATGTAKVRQMRVVCPRDKGL